MHINDILKVAVERKASDVHLKVGAHPVLRIDGRLQVLTEFKRLMQEDTIAMAFSMMSSRQKERFKHLLETDIAYSVPGLGRFRCNIFQQRGSVGLVLRLIPARIQTFKELMLPPVLERICEEQRGLVLVTGTTGSGKSTSLASMIDHINTRRIEHVMTIEDPIEFLHRDKKSIINQREVDVDTKQFSTALRSALRQDPDVILVGEMRDYETIETALLAAETGHLVLSTLHTVDATETINRVISVFPPHQQKQIRIQLAAVLKAIVSMRLLPRADGLGRVPAVEVLISTSYIRDCVENKEKTKLIRDAIVQGTSQYGMQTFDQSLYQLYKNGLITLEEALRRATNPDEFKLKIQGIQSTSDISREEMDGVARSRRGVRSRPVLRGVAVRVRRQLRPFARGDPCVTERDRSTRPLSTCCRGATTSGASSRTSSAGGTSRTTRSTPRSNVVRGTRADRRRAGGRAIRRGACGARAGGARGGWRPSCDSVGLSHADAERLASLQPGLGRDAVRTALRKLEVGAPAEWWRDGQRRARMVSSLITRGFEAEVAIAAVNALAASRENHNDALDDQ